MTLTHLPLLVIRANTIRTSQEQCTLHATDASDAQPFEYGSTHGERRDFNYGASGHACNAREKTCTS